MCKLVAKLQVSVQKVENYHFKLALVKQQLLENKLESLDLLVDEDDRICLGLFVLNEFCNELSAIVVAKNVVLEMCNKKQDETS